MKARCTLPATGLIRRPFPVIALAVGVAAALGAGVPAAYAAARPGATANQRVSRERAADRDLEAAVARPGRRMPDPHFTESVWTGHEMIIHSTFGVPFDRVTLAYHPGTNTWTRLAPGPAWRGLESGDVAVWTGSQMLVFGQTEQALAELRDAAGSIHTGNVCGFR